MNVEHGTQQPEVTYTTRFLHARMGLTGLFSSRRFFSASHGLLEFISSPRFYFSARHTDPPIVGVSNIGHGFNWPETVNQTWESNPGVIKRTLDLQNNVIAWITKNT